MAGNIGEQIMVLDNVGKVLLRKLAGKTFFDNIKKHKLDTSSDANYILSQALYETMTEVFSAIEDAERETNAGS